MSTDSPTSRPRNRQTSCSSLQSSMSLPPPQRMKKSTAPLQARPRLPRARSKPHAAPPQSSCWIFPHQTTPVPRSTPLPRAGIQPSSSTPSSQWWKMTYPREICSLSSPPDLGAAPRQLRPCQVPWTLCALSPADLAPFLEAFFRLPALPACRCGQGGRVTSSSSAPSKFQILQVVSSLRMEQYPVCLPPASRRHPPIQAGEKRGRTGCPPLARGCGSLQLMG